MKQEIDDNINPIKELRESLHMTKKAFSEKVDISKTTLMKIESGEWELSAKLNEVIRGKLGLNADWYQERDYKKKVDISVAEENIIEYIKKSTYYERGARAIYFALKEVFDTTGLTTEERASYIKYIYKIIEDVKDISNDAKAYIKNEIFLVSSNKAQNISGDIMSLYGDSIEDLKHQAKCEVVMTEDTELDF